MKLFSELFRKPEQPKPEPMAMITPYDGVTLHQLYEGCLIMGGIGSGKTSGPGNEVTRFLLRQGCGVLWLCAKSDEADRAFKLCKSAGRENDIVHFHPKGKHRFQFLDYELNSAGGGVQSTGQLLTDLIEFASRSDPSKSQDAFWPMAASRLLRMCMGVVYMAQGTCSVKDLYQMVTSLPPSPDKLTDPEWQQSYCGLALGLAAENHGEDKLEFFAEYLMEELPKLDYRTKSNIMAQVMNTLDPFMSGDLTHLVTEKSTVTPDDLLDGKIIILDCPTLKYREPGKFIQTVWKLATQRMALRRDVNINPKPIGIFQDEAQEFCLPRVDAATQAVGRSAKLISLAITQNIPLVIAALGGQSMEKEAYSWLANFSTKVFCSNHEMAETNKYASELCGHSKHMFYGGSPGGAMHNYDIWDDFMGTRQAQASMNFHEQWHPDVPPEQFAKLKKGGDAFRFYVSAIVTQSGRVWSNGKQWIEGIWNQKQ